MANVFLDIYAGNDPNGSILVTLDDSDIAAFEMRCGENELGAGKVTIRRDHPDATAANMAAGNYVKVRIPLIDDDPVFGFWLDEHDDEILATDEESGEDLSRGGPGTLFILAHARLLDQFYVLTQHSRGNYNVPGYWTWNTEPYGAILVRLIEEGQLQPGFPLQDVTIDWDRQDNSDGADWPSVQEEIQFQIGTDGLTVFNRLVESGELFVRAQADLTVQAFSVRGVDRTSATYATDKIRFVKGENILTGLDRSGHGTGAATHAIVVGKDYKYRQVVAPWYVPGEPGRWTTENYGETNDPTLLDKVGAEALRRRDAGQEAIELEFFAGDDEANGRYLPFKHFNTGDIVTLDTGSGEWDYDNASHRIVGFRIILGPASRDATDEEEARSFRWIAELNVGSGGYHSPNDRSGAGQPCSDCPPAPPRPPFVPGNQAADFVLDLCNSLPTREATYVFDPLIDVSGDWYWEILNTQHDVAAFTDQFVIRYGPGITDLDLFAAMGGTIDGALQGVHPTYGVLPPASGTFNVPASKTGFTILLHTNGYAAPNAPPFDDECWRVSLWHGVAPVAVPPQLGQVTSESMSGTTAGGEYQTNFPFEPGMFHVWVSDSPTSAGVLVTPSEADSADGTFELGFDATGQTVTVTYQIASTTGTGASNPPPSSTDTPFTAGVTDHGALTGLSDDDHPQYATNVEFDDHNARHEPGGADPMAVDAAVGVGSLRTLGTGATQAAAGPHTHGTVDADAVRDAGRWEIVMTPGITSPPEPVWTPDGTDYVYAWIPG